MEHEVQVSGTIFNVNPDTREVTSGEVKKLICGDHKSTRYGFKMQRFINGHDMSLCDEITIHTMNVSANGRVKVEDIYEVYDCEIDPEDENSITWTWLVERGATQYEGRTGFGVCFRCLTDDAIDYDWNTELCKDEIQIGEGQHNEEALQEVYFSFIEQWWEELQKKNEGSCIKKPYAGKRLIAFGTSMVANCVKYNGGYLERLKELCGFESYENAGVGGIAMVDKVNAEGNTVAGILSRIKSRNDLDDYDVLQIHCGGNDFVLEYPLGHMDDILTPFTFIAALKDTIEYLQTNFPKLEIFITVPHRSKRNNSLHEGETEGQYWDDYTNIVGHKQEDYVDACVRVCNKYGVPAIDLYRNSGISGTNYLTYIEDDGTHLNALGYEQIAKVIAGVLNSHHGATYSADTGLKLDDHVVINGTCFDLSNKMIYEYRAILKLGNTLYAYTSHAPLFLQYMGKKTDTNGEEYDAYAETFVPSFSGRAPRSADGYKFDNSSPLGANANISDFVTTFKNGRFGYYTMPGTFRKLDGLILASNHNIKKWGTDEILFYKNFN